MSLDDVVLTKAVTALSPALALLREPPSWTRLEPVSITGEPGPGLAAAVHDPLWLLGRQWQLGELRGEDAGTPLSVRIASTSAPLAGLRAGEAAADDVVPLGGTTLLEPIVEREPPGAGGASLRARADAGSAFLAALDDVGLGTLRATVLAQAALPAAADPPAPPDPADPAHARLTRVLGGRLPDGEAVAAAVEAALAAGDGRPAWLPAADDAEAAALDGVCADWLAWYRAEVAPAPQAPAPDSWVDGHLEYGFDVSVAAPGGELTLTAPEFPGGSVDWYAFRRAEPGRALGTGEAAPSSAVQRLQASRLRYPGMPADRLFEMEDGRVNLGALEAEPHDLARLLLAEFALTYGGDWLVVPFDVPVGAVTTVTSVVVTTTFGEHLVVRPATTPGWRMFETDGLPGLLAPPAAVHVLEGPALEDVLFLRDEMANLVWAVERTVTGPSGDPHDRATEPPPVPATGGPVVERAELDWVLQTTTPAHWFPYLPTSDGYREVGLRRARVSGQQPPAGRLVAEEAQRHLFDGEVPRDGVRVRRVPVVARRADGTYERWVTRRVSTGRGEGWSGLAFDGAVRRTGG